MTSTLTVVHGPSSHDQYFNFSECCDIFRPMLLTKDESDYYLNRLKCLSESNSEIRNEFFVILRSPSGRFVLFNGFT